MAEILQFPTPHIRRAAVTELEPVVDLVHDAWREVYGHHLPLPLVNGHSRSETADLVLSGADGRWVATAGGRLSGYCSVIANCVDQLWVSRRQRRRGIGGALLDQALASIHQRGYEFAQAGIEDFNTQARDFLEGRGWRLIGAEQRELATGRHFRALVYALDLRQRPWQRPPGAA